MKEIGAYEAKTHLPRLLEEVSKGEHYTITRHGIPVALLVPVTLPKSRDLATVVEKMKQLHSKLGIKGLSAKQAKEAGRKY